MTYPGGSPTPPAKWVFKVRDIIFFVLIGNQTRIMVFDRRIYRHHFDFDLTIAALLACINVGGLVLTGSKRPCHEVDAASD